MAKGMKVETHHSIEELERRAAATKHVDDWLRIRAVLLARRGLPARDILAQLPRGKTWLYRVINAYNQDGDEAFMDGRRDNGAERIVDEETHVVLLHAVEHEEPPGGGLWTREKVRCWLAEEHDTEVSSATAYRTMIRAGLSLQQPRPANEQADDEAQEAFKKGASNKR
jgi:transposase